MTPNTEHATATPLVLSQQQGAVRVLTLNRPEKRNALSRALVAQLSDAIDQAAWEGGTRVVLLAATGKVFCSGLDLAEASSSLESEQESSRHAVADMKALADLIDQIHRLKKPVVAAVQGDALAGGAGLALACDYVVMDETARIGYPEVRVGMVAAIVAHDLVRQAGERRARQLLLSGELIDARTAQSWGLVNETVAAFACQERALAVANGLCASAPGALATTKQVIDDASRRPESLRSAAAVSALVREGDEAREGMRAFFEKRPPHWADHGGSTKKAT